MPADRLIRILTVDDHALLRRGIAALVNAEPDMELVAQAASGEEAIQQFRKYRPDVTLMDLQMAGMSGIEAIIAIRSDFPQARVVVLTNYLSDVHVLRALRAGARGYVLKGHVDQDLSEVIRAVHAGKKKIPPEVAAELAEHTEEDDLTPREIEVLRLVAAGNANKEIATRLSIAEDTVKSHVAKILAKLHANDRTHAVTTAIKRGILELLSPEWMIAQWEFQVCEFFQKSFILESGCYATFVLDICRRLAGRRSPAITFVGWYRVNPLRNRLHRAGIACRDRGDRDSWRRSRSCSDNGLSHPSGRRPGGYGEDVDWNLANLVAHGRSMQHAGSSDARGRLGNDWPGRLVH